MVKNKKTRRRNQDFNDAKFYQLKQKLIYKASVAGKKVIYVREHHTTKTCSGCGKINYGVGSLEVFKCRSRACKLVTGRDINAAKNMKMKGILG